MHYGDPPMINSKIRRLMEVKSNPKKWYIFKNKNIKLFGRLHYIQNLLTATTETSKKQFFFSQISNNLMNFTVSLKRYWSILKTFLDNKKITVMTITVI